ncbi:hypothetical protein RSOLAG1IB_02038 [Rhizoctonia solani AG-1 IB]|uniref:Uncharacterized protein n=1 Tax=Thanatephorus cucumeris (strain AG1-IB / isolate 7/3/14) TaxID=1108050 RepID=A0A0B7FGJ3_THACB|nr:hypothetical protein RSOLAG1IB_02038 [Rhizoctonia solani AG-1 IB]
MQAQSNEATKSVVLRQVILVFSPKQTKNRSFDVGVANASSSVDPHLYDDELITQGSRFNRLRLTFLRPGCFA